MHSFAVLPKGHNRYFLWFEALSLRNRSPSARFGHAYAYAAGMQDAMNIRAHWQLARHCYDSESNILPDIFPALAITLLTGRFTQIHIVNSAARESAGKGKYEHFWRQKQHAKEWRMNKLHGMQRNKLAISIPVIFYRLEFRRLADFQSISPPQLSRISFHHNIHETTRPRGSPVNNSKRRRKRVEHIVKISTEICQYP